MASFAAPSVRKQNGEGEPVNEQVQPIRLDGNAIAGELVLQEFRTYVVLELRGTIDAKLRAQAGETFATIMQRRLPVHLSACNATFADPASWAFIVQLITACHAAGIPTHLDPNDHVIASVLQELGLSQSAGAA